MSHKYSQAITTLKNRIKVINFFLRETSHPRVMDSVMVKEKKELLEAIIALKTYARLEGKNE
jgi:hypothetical protein